MKNFQSRLQDLKSTIPESVKIVAVSKTKPVEDIQEAYETGQRIFGENKVQEMLNKFLKLPVDIDWHLIGHLQSNKVKQVVSMVGMIHSVDSLKLLNKIQTESQKINRVVPCLIQVHIAMEDSKFGFAPEEVEELFQHLQMEDYPNVRFCGLMGMASFVDDDQQVTNEFRLLKNLFDKLRAEYMADNPDFQEISMGMTGDYKLAVSQGSTMIRVGTLLFGSRS